MSLYLVPEIAPVVDTATDGGDVKPEIVSRGRGSYTHVEVSAWESLNKLASGADSPEWSETTVLGFIDTARVLIGRCVGGEEVITRAKFADVGIGAMDRARKIAILRNRSMR